MITLPSPPLSEREKVCIVTLDVMLCVSTTLVLMAKVIRCIQCCLVYNVFFLD